MCFGQAKPERITYYIQGPPPPPPPPPPPSPPPPPPKQKPKTTKKPKKLVLPRQILVYPLATIQRVSDLMLPIHLTATSCVTLEQSIVIRDFVNFLSIY